MHAYYLIFTKMTLQHEAWGKVTSDVVSKIAQLRYLSQEHLMVPPQHRFSLLVFFYLRCWSELLSISTGVRLCTFNNLFINHHPSRKHLLFQHPWQNLNIMIVLPRHTTHSKSTQSELYNINYRIRLLISTFNYSVDIRSLLPTPTPIAWHEQPVAIKLNSG